MAVNATAIWRARPSGNNANGGGFDPGIASPGTDRSQQNAAQVVFNGGTITATTAGVSNVITFAGGTGYTATAADIANCLHITGGTNFIVGWYFITAQGGTTWTLDRNCTSGAGAAMTGNMGGGWADFWTNTTATAAVLVPGNTIFILGSGAPNPASYTFDYVVPAGVVASALVAGDLTNGYVTFANDTATPGYKAPPNTTGGMPCIQLAMPGAANFVWNIALNNYEGLFFVAANTAVAADVIFAGLANTPNVFFGCVYDQVGTDTVFYFRFSASFIGCEFFSSITTGSTGASGAISYNATAISGVFVVVGCNFHDCVGQGVRCSGTIGTTNQIAITNTIVAKCRSHGINFGLGAAEEGVGLCLNNTIDGNGTRGIYLQGASSLAAMVIMNNIISNHTGTPGNGIECIVGTLAQANLIKSIIDYNTFYNNTTDVSGISYGAHDTHGGANPYVNQLIQNYTLR